MGLEDRVVITIGNNNFTPVCFCSVSRVRSGEPTQCEGVAVWEKAMSRQANNAPLLENQYPSLGKGEPLKITHKDTNVLRPSKVNNPAGRSSYTSYTLTREQVGALANNLQPGTHKAYLPRTLTAPMGLVGVT